MTDYQRGQAMSTYQGARAADEYVAVTREAAADSRAAAEASNAQARRLVFAAWALIAPTVALAVSPVVLVIVTARSHS